jgi:hypothetical protein
VDLWFSLTFINIPLITILLGGFDIIVVDLVVIVDATVDVVGSTVVVVFSVWNSLLLICLVLCFDDISPDFLNKINTTCATI